MFQVKPMSFDDFPFATILANTMNWNMATEDFEFLASLEPEGCFVVFQGSERLGIATSISYGKVGWFGNLIVKEKYRNTAHRFLIVHSANTCNLNTTLVLFPHIYMLNTEVSNSKICMSNLHHYCTRKTN